jgi:hypothetical protein
MTRSPEHSETQLRQRLSWCFLSALLLSICLWQLWLIWTRPPVVQTDNLRFVQLIRTACSSKRQDYLLGVEKSLQSQQASEPMSAAEQSFFQRILDLAKNGKWDEADRLAQQLENAQLNRRR